MDDWKKLKRVLSWVKETIDNNRIIGANTLKYVYMWIDAAYVVHSDMRSCTGGDIYTRHGVLHEKASVKRLNKNLHRGRASWCE